MSTFSANYTLKRIGYGRKPQHIGPGAGKHNEHFGVFTEMMLKELLCFFRIIVISISYCMSVVCLYYGLQQCGIDTGIVIACKSSVVHEHFILQVKLRHFFNV